MKNTKKIHSDRPGIQDFKIKNSGYTNNINGEYFDIWKYADRKHSDSKVVFIQVFDDKFAMAYRDPCGWHIADAEYELYTVVE